MSLNPSDPRLLAMQNWLTTQLNIKIQSLKPASSDASFRRYFRLIHSSGQHIIMDAPPAQENTEPFIRIAGLFSSVKLPVPHIFAADTEQGFLMLEDFGSQCLLDQIHTDNADILYQAALDNLFTLQSHIPVKECRLNHYDQPLLVRELAIFNEWFAAKLLKIAIPATLTDELNTILVQSALQQPQVCVHRDYHSRNLMVLNDNQLGIIDFQDAVVGPITYDLVSLLRDCYLSWPQHRVDDWVEAYFQRLSADKLVTADLQQFRRWFDLMGLQRHLKAVGIFARLHLRDNKSAYLKDIPRTLSYIEAISALYPELANFSEFLQQQLLPLYRESQ